MHRRMKMKFELCDVIFNCFEVDNLEIHFYSMKDGALLDGFRKIN